MEQGCISLFFSFIPTLPYMSVNTSAYQQLKNELDTKGVTLVAVSKTKPVADIESLYALGQRDFGENYVQELLEKAPQLPADIRWHFIGHLQTNKVKLIIPLVQLIHGVDSLKLLQEIHRQAEKKGRVVDCLLQVHIAQEETKFGLDEGELMEILENLPAKGWNHVRVTGLMGMASFTDDREQVRKEFGHLKSIFDRARNLGGPAFSTLSMGMSGDYALALQEGSNMVRIGSLLFGERPPK